MSISCPNKRLVAWKNLVKNVGENKAYVLWSEYDGNVPDNYYESNIQSNKINYQKNQTISNDGIIASEKTIRDLAAKIADRIGMKVAFESDRSKDYKGKIAYFGGIDKCRFKGKVQPGDKLKLEMKVMKQKGPMGVGEAVATVDGKVVVKAELTFMVG